VTSIAPLRTDTAAYLRALQPVQVRALLPALGIAEAPGGAGTVSAVETAACSLAGLERLRARLPPDAWGLLLRWVLRGDRARPWPDPYGSRTDPLDDAAYGRAADALYRLGLAHAVHQEIAVLPALARGLALTAEDYAVRSAAVVPDDAPPWPFVAALIAAAVTAEATTLTQREDLHATGRKKLEARLGGPGLYGRSVEAFTEILRQHRVLVPVARGARVVLTLSAPAARAYFGREAGDLSLCGVHAFGGGDLSLRTLAALRHRTAAGGHARFAEVHGLASALAAVGRCPEAAADAWKTRLILANLVLFGLAAPAPGSPMCVRATTPPPHGSTPFVVQPSFDVLVPWDASPARTALLGAVADLEAVDRVCRFRITDASVRRGVEVLGDGDAVVAVLRDGADRPLPDNVLATLRGWTARPRDVHGVRGEMIVAYDDAQRAFVRRAFPGAHELVPGAFLVEAGALDDLPAAARKARVPTAPARASPEPIAAGRDADRRADRVGEDAEVVRGARDALDAYAAHLRASRPAATPDARARPVPPPPRAPRPRRPAAPPSDAPPRFDAADGVTWRPLLPGALEAHLRAAQAAGTPVRVLYVNGQGRRAEHVLGTFALLDVRGRLAVEASPPDSTLRARYWLDQVLAVAVETT